MIERFLDWLYRWAMNTKKEETDLPFGTIMLSDWE